MPGSLPRQKSPWTRTRHWTTLACALCTLAGLIALVGGHLIHGALLLLAAGVLLPGSVLGRRHKRHPAHGVGSVQPGSQAASKLRKAA